MAVIYVPKDTRWADAAQGLGQLLTTYVQAQQQNKLTNNVAQIMNDPTVSGNPSAQLAQVAKLGAPAVQIFTNLLSNQAKVAQIGLAGAETEKDLATAQQIQGMTPEQIAEARANIAATGARTNLTQAMVPQEQARTQQIQAQIPGVAAQSQVAQQVASAGGGTAQVNKTKAETEEASATAAQTSAVTGSGIVGSQADVEAAKASSLQAQTKVMQGLLGPANPQAPQGPTGGDLILDKAGITDPAAREAAKNALVTEGVTGWTRALEEAAKVQQQNAKQDVLPEDIRKNLDTSSKMATTLQPFLQPSSDASATGFAAGIQGWLAKKGLTSDPDLLSKMTAGEQAMGSYAESGSGFGGQWRVKLGYDLTPQIGHTAVANVIATQQIANAQIAQLKQQKQQTENIPKYKESQPAIDQEIQQYQEIADKANTLWWGYDGQDGKGNGTGKIHFYYQGNEVDPKTLQPLDTSTYRVNPGYSTKMKQQVSDEYIQRVARLVGVTPQTEAALLGVKQ